MQPNISFLSWTRRERELFSNFFRAVAFLMWMLPSPLMAASTEQIQMVRAAQQSAYAVTGSTNGCRPTNEFSGQGWHDALIRYCEYELQDKGVRQPRKAIAYLLDVEAGRIAAWVANACDYLVEKQTDCFVKLVRLAKLNSGMMFPVAGNMLEDMDRPKFYKNYIFQNGMTVAPRLDTNGSSVILPLEAQRRLIRYKADELAGIKSGKTRYWGTVPSQVRSRFPDLNAPARLNEANANARWLELVRKEMLASLTSDRNRLLEAYLCANAQALFKTTCREP